MNRVGLVVLIALAGACDPVWGVNVDLRDPSDRPVAGATVAVACATDSSEASQPLAVRSDTRGEAYVGSLGSRFPVGCDLYIAKRGYQTHRVRYRDLCPSGPERCERGFSFELVLEPERSPR